jgi:hypothetical protein
MNSGNSDQDESSLRREESFIPSGVTVLNRHFAASVIPRYAAAPITA